MTWIEWLVDDSRFTPRWMCGGWDDSLINANILANVAIWLAYTAIACEAVVFWRRIRGRLFKTWVVLLTATFVLACGATHMAQVLAFWWAPYRAFTAVDLVAAALAMAVAVALPPVFRYLEGMPSARQLADARDALEISLQVAERQVVERERARVDVENTNRFLLTKLGILQDRLRSETDHAARMADIDDVRTMIEVVSAPEDHP